MNSDQSKGNKGFMRGFSADLLGAVLAPWRGPSAFARRSLPQTNGTLQLPGLDAQVQVYRDERGVPHIEAETLHDLYTAQGFVTAQDRLWQMDMSRRLACGRMSEVMGAATLRVDKLYRIFSLRNAAEKSLTLYTGSMLEYLECYSAGVNAYLEQAQREGRLPVEFALLGYQPELWTAVDTLTLGKLLANDLSHNMASESFRFQLLKKVGPELLQQVLPVYPADGPVSVGEAGSSAAQLLAETETAVSDATLHDVLEFADAVSSASKGSNCWVVSGKLTQSGKPILANDPHVGMQTPSIWYQTHLVVEGEMNVTGVTMPGVLGIILGHNDNIAWGVTNNRADVQDLFIERRHPEHRHLFEHQGEWVEAEIRKETIKVKGKPDVPFEVVVTAHGPVLSPLLGEGTDGLEEALTMQWTAHRPTAELEAFLLINKAQDWPQFRDALRKYQTPVLNFLFAATDGTTAFRVGGSIPRRAKGDGLLPVPGWSGEYDWTDDIPFEELPEEVNPERGYLVSANNKVIGDSYPYLITHSWDAHYRAERIAGLLTEGRKFTVQDMARMQGDMFNLQAEKLLPKLLPYLERATLTALERAALELLQAWDLIDHADQSAPLVYHLWWDRMSRQVFERKMGAYLYKRMVDVVSVTDRALHMAAEGMENDWVKEAGGVERVVVESFRLAVARLVKGQGSTPADWSWGKFHRFDPKHPLGKAVPLLGRLLNPNNGIGIGGSDTTVALMAHDAEGVVINSAPWRMVADLNDLAVSQDMNAPGQSAHFLSGRYEDQTALYVGGELRTQRFCKEQYRGFERLLLCPQVD